MPALDAVVLLAGNVSRALATNHDAGFLRVDLDLVSSKAGKFGGQYEGAGGLVEIDGWGPAGRVGADELTDLIVEREQIAQRIPPREGHVGIVACLVGRGHMCYDRKDIRARASARGIDHSSYR